MALSRKYGKLTSHADGSTVYESGNNDISDPMPVKKKPGRKSVYIHKCSEKIQLNRMRLILVGNGDPKTGLAFKMEESIKDVSEIKTSISDIKKQLGETIIAASTAASSLEKYKIEVKSFELGKDDAEEKQRIADDLKKRMERESWQRVIWIIMAGFAFIGLIANLYFNIKGHTETNQKVEAVQDTIRQEMRYQEGMSKVTKGGYVKYNDAGLSDSIKIRK